MSNINLLEELLKRKQAEEQQRKQILDERKNKIVLPVKNTISSTKTMLNNKNNNISNTVPQSKEDINKMISSMSKVNVNQKQVEKTNFSNQITNPTNTKLAYLSEDEIKEAKKTTAKINMQNNALVKNVKALDDNLNVSGSAGNLWLGIVDAASKGVSYIDKLERYAKTEIPAKGLEFLASQFSKSEKDVITNLEINGEKLSVAEVNSLAEVYKNKDINKYYQLKNYAKNYYNNNKSTEISNLFKVSADLKRKYEYENDANHTDGIIDWLSDNWADDEDVNKKRQEKMQSNIDKAQNGVGSKLAELTGGMGSTVLGMAGTAVNPALGIALFSTSAAGGYYEDAKQRGMTEGQSLGYATVMAGMEGATEKYITGDMVSKIKKIATGSELSPKILKSFGMNIAENFAQEALTEPISEVTAYAIGGKDSSNFDDMHERMLESGWNGLLSATILAGASAGVGSALSVTQKGKNATLEETVQAYNDTVESGKVDQSSIAKGVVTGLKEQVNTFKEKEAKDKRNDKKLPNLKDVIAENDIDNNTDLSYNSIESDGGIDGYSKNEQRRIEDIYKQENKRKLRESENTIDTTTRESFMGSKIKNDAEKFYEEFEQQARKYQLTQLSSEQEQVRNIAKKIYNKDAIYYNDSNTKFQGGISKLDMTSIFFGQNAIAEYGETFLLGHEIAEDMLKHHNEIVGKQYEEMTTRIQNDDNFPDLFLDYIYSMDEELRNIYIEHPEAIAKELICDTLGFMQNDNELGNNLPHKDITDIWINKLDSTLLKDLKSILKKSHDDIYLKNLTNSKNKTENDIDNNTDLSYNNIKGDGGIDERQTKNIEQREFLRNNEAMREQERRGNTTNFKNTEGQDISSRNGQSNISQKTIEQEYNDIETIKKTMEYAKQNQIKIPTKELIDVQNKAKELGINLIAYNGENGNTHLGLTNGSDVYLDLNRKNISKEDGSLMDRFSHEVLHYIKRNTSFEDTINELRLEIVNENPEAIDNFIISKGYEIKNISENFKKIIAEEILGDYCAKHISSYDIEYGLPENITYVLNTSINDAISELKIKNNSLNNSEDDLRQKITQEENKMAQNRNIEPINNIMNNKKLPMQSYIYEKSDNIIIDRLRQDAHKYFNNTKQAHQYVEMLEQLIKDKGVEIRFDTNLKTADGKVASGSYSNGVITINPNSNRAGEFIAIHELTHAIGTKQMINMVEKYRKSNAEFDSAIKSLLQNYNTTEITEEALSDVSAQLFGNQEFINNIANTNPSFFQKVYSEIKYLWHQFRGYKNQNQFIEDLYYKWTQAYRKNSKFNESTNYSIQTDNKGNKYVKVDADQNIFEGKSLKEKKQIARDYILDKFRENGIIKSNENINISRRTANEYTNPKNIENRNQLSDKLKASTELDNLLTISKYKYSAKDDGRHIFANKGWDYYETTFQIGNKAYTGLLNIANGDKGKLLYDITQIKETTIPYSVKTVSMNSSSSNNSITSTQNNVNRTTTAKYSMQESENNSTNDNSLEKKYSNLNLNENISNLDGVPAIELSDGSILPIKTPQTPHVQFIKDNQIDVEDIKSGGFITNGIYEGSYESDTGSYVEREKARKRIEQKKNSKLLLPTDEWYDYLSKQFKSTGTRTNLEDIKLPTREYFENNNVLDKVSVTKSNKINEKVQEYINNIKGDFKTNIELSIKSVTEDDKLPIKYTNQLGQSMLSKKAKSLVDKLKKRVFVNNNEQIYVTNTDINKSIAETLQNKEQQLYIKENLSVFSKLDKIIENAEEISSSEKDNKERIKYNNYKYYVTKVKIDGLPFIVEFDTRMQKGTTGKEERHFRLERLYKYNKTSSSGGTDNSITHFSDELVSNKNISQKNKNVNIYSENKPMKDKARKYINRNKKRFINNIVDKFQTSYYSNKDILNDTMDKLINEIETKGSIDKTTASEIFEELYSKMIKIDETYYNEFKDVKNDIRKTKLYVPEDVKGSITDYNDFRQNNMGNLILTSDSNNISIEAKYKELSSQYPSLFPDSIINPADQLKRMSEVQKDIAKTETNVGAYLDSTMGAEYKKWAKYDFEKALDDFVEDVNLGFRYNNDIKSNNNNVELNELKDIFEQLPYYKKEYERVANKEVLTARDEVQLDRLLKGEITIDELPRNTNVKGIKKVYEAKLPYQTLLNSIQDNKAKLNNDRINDAKNLIANADNWKDKKIGLQYNRETAKRNIYDIMPKEDADKIYKKYFEPYSQHEAQVTREINRYNDMIKELNIGTVKKYKIFTGTKVSESALVQMFGENRISLEDLKNSGVDVEKIEKATKVFREIYDELFDKLNESSIRNGYNPIQKRKDYFPHFTETKPDTLLSKLASKVGIDLTNQELPTDIAGITAQFKPGRKWMGNLLHRYSDITDFDVLKGFDNYVRNATDIIYHTEDIKNLRALNNVIRYNYSDSGIQEKINNIKEDNSLDELEKVIQIQELFENKDTTHLSNFITWLNEYTNNIAGKKSMADRNWEYNLGRNIYNTMSNLEKRISANMIAGNVSVALTNFAPLAQAKGEIKAINLANGLWNTLKNTIKNDNSFVNSSNFITNRRGTDYLSISNIDRIVEKITSPLNLVDDMISETIVRAKYYENLQNGMQQDEALQNADEYTAGLMADRSKGQLPITFNNKNPIAKLNTMFQVEVNNQWSYYFKDLPRNISEGKFQSAKLVGAYTKIAIGSYLFNEMINSIRGGDNRVVPDIINIVVELIKGLTDDDDDETTWETLVETGLNIASDLPFVSFPAALLGVEDLGRIPVSGAVPNFVNVGKSALGLITGDMNKGKAQDTLKKEFSKPLYYILPTAGGAQIKKSTEAIKTIQDGGSYSVDSEGNKVLQFPATDLSLVQKVQAGIFGKYALPMAKEYTERGYKILSDKQTKLYEETKLPYRQLLDYIDAGLTKTEDKINYVNSQDMTENQKWGIYKYNIFSSAKRADGSSQVSDAEYIIKNGVSKSEYMNLYNKAVLKNIDMPTADEYKEMKTSGLSLNKYIDYNIKVKDTTEKKKEVEELEESQSLKNADRIQILLDSNYSDKEIKAIYENYICNVNDSNYNIMKSTDIDVREYLKYKQQEFDSDKEDDGTVDGKTVSGSKKKKVYSYVNSMNVNYNQKLLLLGQQYKLTTEERTKLANYVNSLSLTKQEKLDVYGKLKGFTVYKNGMVKW